MENYECLSVVGEGSYGMVIKCRHRQSGQLVAIKKFLEPEDDVNVRKMALREIRMLRRLRHDNLVNLLQVFRRKRRFHLVFEYIDHTILNEVEANPNGLGEIKCQQYAYQVVRGVNFCHCNNVIHRDIKPENVLVSNLGVVKLCDFGFARQLTGNSCDVYTEYVATRWYRAPELLVPDSHYGTPVDIWAVGCLFSEMMTGDALFPGDSDVDQLFLIMSAIGRLSQRHQQLVLRNPIFRGLKPNLEVSNDLHAKFAHWHPDTFDFLSSCLKMDPQLRSSSKDLLQHPYFSKDSFHETFQQELRRKIVQESHSKPIISRKLYGSAPRRICNELENKGKSVDFLEERSPTKFAVNRSGNIYSRSQLSQDYQIMGDAALSRYNQNYYESKPSPHPLPSKKKNFRKTQLTGFNRSPLANTTERKSPVPPPWLPLKKPTQKHVSYHLQLPMLPAERSFTRKAGKKKKSGDNPTPTPRHSDQYLTSLSTIYPPILHPRT